MSSSVLLFFVQKRINLNLVKIIILQKNKCQKNKLKIILIRHYAYKI